MVVDVVCMFRVYCFNTRPCRSLVVVIVLILVGHPYLF